MKTLLKFVSARKRKAVRVAVLGCAVVSLLPACATRSQFQKGYDAGASDTVKRQYWILQNMQKRQDGNQAKPHLYRLTVQPDPNATVNKVPYDISFPAYE